MYWEYEGLLVLVVMMLNRKMSCLCVFVNFGEFLIFLNWILIFIKVIGFCFNCGIVFLFIK